ncbi:VPS35 endosomal protein-sorting factor-like [Oscarella lobularis]|uniref:VPS35 endosomal protein-sorting factor-like n=1 Tax=Oscarella lobularis TaxID=121494 RepID=UPI0033138BFA
MASTEWAPIRRNYERERKTYAMTAESCTNHPLKANVVQIVEDKKTKTPPLAKKAPKAVDAADCDPLGASDPLAALDPLTSAATAVASSGGYDMPDDEGVAGGRGGGLDDEFEPWAAKKAGILSKYTTDEKLSITTSFLTDEDREKVIVKAQTTSVSEKVKHRLEQLDDFEEGSVKEMMNLSQKEYVKKIDDMNQALKGAWENDHRVKTLKIGIQCAKLLVDVSVIKFYPSKFVLITDILDTFGELVYQRIRQKSMTQQSGSSKPIILPENFTPEQVPEMAKETCRNWFFKIASIRELIPRFYVETAILKCYNYLTTGEYRSALTRLSRMIRGIGNPLVATYARAYICRVGMTVAPDVRDHLQYCFGDFVQTYGQFQLESVQNTIVLQHVDSDIYMDLYAPALDWILQCIAYKTSENALEMILENCQKHCNTGVVLNAVMSSFKPEFVSARALKFCEMIRECEEAGVAKWQLYKTLGMNLVLSDPPEECRMQVLNEVWKTVKNLKEPNEYVGCAEVWAEFPVKHFGKREINTILGDVVKHMTPDRAYEKFYPQLQSVMTKILTHVHDFSMLFSLDKFLAFLDLFQRESVKVEVCRSVMEAFSKHVFEPTNDPVVISTLLYVGKVLHDSVNALSNVDELRSTSNVIISFIRNIHFGKDFEQQLNFYVDARNNFTGLEPVLIVLVQSVNHLAIRTRQVVNGHHTRKTAAFVRACAAYCYITIPSIHDLFSRLNLYLITGQVAILNQALAQGDAFLKAAISLIPEVPKTIDVDGSTKSTEPMVQRYLTQFVASLLYVPDDPDHGIHYILKGLLNTLQEYDWDRCDAKVNLYVDVYVLLCASSQDRYAFGVDKVDTNDDLYAGDRKYVAELGKIAKTILEEILTHLKSLSDGKENQTKQAALAFRFFCQLIIHADVENPNVSALATNLWNLSQKHGLGDTKHMARTIRAVKARGGAWADLAGKMTLQSRA